MPWECNACNTLVANDLVQVCPSCEVDKSAWSLEADVSRQFVIAKKKFECLRTDLEGAVPGGSDPYRTVEWTKAEEVRALKKAAVKRLIDQGKLPAPKDVLCVRVKPGAKDDRWANLTPLFEAADRHSTTAALAADQDAGAEPFEVYFSLVYGEPYEEVLTLNGPGRVMFVDVTDATEEGFVPEVEVQAVKKPKKSLPVVAALNQVELLELEDANFRTESCCVMPGGLEPEGAGADESDDVEREVSVFAAALRYMAEHPDKKLLVAGHTDTTGTVQYNQPLSEQRAGAAHAVLVGDRERFKDLVLNRHKTADYQQILKWVFETFGWPCDPGKVNGVHSNATSVAIRDFQQAYNDNDFAGNPEGTPIDVDGWMGSQTWKAMFDCYQLGLREELGEDVEGLEAIRAGILPLDAELPSVGCSEHHPIDGLGQDDYKSEANRRVEILLFDPGEEPALDCHPGPACKPELCQLYDVAQYDRRHLPPMVSAKKWTARWEGEAKTGSTATMVLDAPGLPAGTPVTFTVRVEGAGVVETVEAVADDERCELQFAAWGRAQPETPPRMLAADEPFPAVRFAFVVTGGGREVMADPIAFEDTIDLEVVDQVGTLLRDTKLVLRTPWGSRPVMTSRDGELQATGLPPGGLRLAVDGKVAAHA